MTQQKKKQVSIAAFFSPKPAKKRPAPADKAEDATVNATPPPAQTQASGGVAKPGKRPRVSPTSATATPTDAVTATPPTDAVTVTPPVGKPTVDKEGAASESKAATATGKRTTAATAGKQQKQKQQKQKKTREPKTRAKGKVLFTSPHELGDDEDDLDDDLEEATAAAQSAPMEDTHKEEDSHNEEAAKEEPMEIELTPVKPSRATATEDKSPSSVSVDKDNATTEETSKDAHPTPSSDQAIDLTASPVRPPPRRKKTQAATTHVTQDLTQDAATDGNAAGAAAKKPRGRRRAATPSAAKTPKKSAGRAAVNWKSQSNGSEGGSKPAADATATSPEVQVVLDPAVQARVDTYQLKLRDLTQACTELLIPGDATDANTSEESAHDAQRALLQDVYGVGLDIELDVSTDEQEMATAITDVWSKWRTEAVGDSTATAGGTSELPHAVKAFIAKHTQGRSATLSSLCDDLMTKLQTVVASDDSNTDEATRKRVVARAALAIDMEIKMLAQRTPYGAKPPPRANLFEDTTPEVLWIWEIGNPERFYKDEAHKILKRVRKHRKRVGQQLKSLARVVKLLHQSPVDEAKVSAEEAKVGKFVLAVEAELSRSRDRERKELERAHAAEEKKRADEEKKQAKEDEKKQREEAERELATKRKKSLVSYFRSIDTESAAASAVTTSAAGISVPVESATSAVSASGAASTGQVVFKPIEVENSSETIARMDAAISFLHRSAEANNPPSTSGLMYPWKEARVSGTARRMVARGSTQSWTSKRRRDAKRGVMKLLQFHENSRPAFFGTFGERSGVFCGGRRPLARFKKFDYTVDSDDEWEEEEPGESLSDADSDNGDDSDDDNLDYGDNWLAYEDEVEYMDDVEGEDGDDEDDEDIRSADDNESGSPQRHRKRKLPSQLEQKRRKKLSKLTRLEPKVVGPFWCQTDACNAHFQGAMTGQLLVMATTVSFESPLMRRAREHEQQEAEKQRKKQEELARKSQQQAEKQAAEEKEMSKVTTPVKPRKAAAATATVTAPVTNSPAPTAAAPATSPQPQQPGITAWFQPQPKSATAASVVPGPASSASTSQTTGTTASDAVVVDEDEDEDGSDVEMVPVDE